MADASVGDLVKQASEEFADLVRTELRLGLAEMGVKGRRAARGGVWFAAAGVLAFVGFEALVAAGVVALGLRLELWAAALIAGGTLLAAAALLALAARRQTARAAPLRPEEALTGVRADWDTIRERAVHHDKHAGEASRAGRGGT